MSQPTSSPGPAGPAAAGALARLAPLLQNTDIVLAGAVMVIIGMMVIPLPPAMLDLLVASNIAAAVMILLIAMYTKEVLEFSVFPSLLLLVTLFRLAINVSSTRLILLRGDAGEIIESFGNFVVGGSILVGIVVFLILLVIQFVVITNGAGRVAEVAARFTLDAMPGKQMSIDADLNAGVISEGEARERRGRIAQEADFYGSMDGASKFVKGDAIAGLIIVAINLVGGIAIGMTQHGLGPQEALSTFALLTVGDGLVSQIPALLVSTATGIVVTRANTNSHLGAEITQQLFGSSRALFIVAAVLAVFGVVPGLPRFPFFVLAATMATAGYLVREHHRAEGLRRVEEDAAEVEEAAQSVDSVISMLQVDPLEVEVGYGLIPLVDEDHGGSVLNRITVIRRQVAGEMGIIVPMVRIRDNLELPPSAYVTRMRGIEIGRGELMVHHYLAMNPGGATEEISGVDTLEPAFGLPARWIAETEKQRAELLGYTVVDAPSVLATHLSELIRRHAPELLSRQDTQRLLDHLRQEAPTLVEELVPGVLTVGEVQGVLQELLREAVSIRDLVTIGETLADRGRHTKDVEALAEFVREALSRQITMQYRQADGRVHALTLHPRLEQQLAGAVQVGEQGVGLALDPATLQRVLGAVGRAVEGAAMRGHQPVLLVSSRLRRPLRSLLGRSLPQLPVLSYREIASEVDVEAIGTVEVESHAA